VVHVKVDSKVYDKPEMLMDMFRINQMVDTFWDKAISHRGGQFKNTNQTEAGVNLHPDITVIKS
jgi:hypothetical protein